MINYCKVLLVCHVVEAYITSGGSRISRRGGVHPLGGRPLMRALFGENVCKNERIGSHRGGRAPGHAPPQDPPMISVQPVSEDVHVLLLPQL